MTTNGKTRRGAKGSVKRRASTPSKAIRDLLSLFMTEMNEGMAASDLDLAQEKAFDAMEISNPSKRLALAREALAISPLCADAYLILAREEKSPEDALALYRRAVEAGAQALGETAFKDDVGLFWGLIETRPYMRARHELAIALWAAGERDDAVRHYQDMLGLNPNDNQGIRYCLLDALIELDREKEATELLKRYKDDASAAWAWSGALLAFRRAGDVAPARKALARAIKANTHVSAYLLGKKALPRSLPEYIGMGDVNEAVAYAHGAAGAWAVTVGAKAWLADALASKSPAPSIAGGKERTDIEPDCDPERIDEAVLALLLLGIHDGNRVWKTFDWATMNRLHAKGLITNPASRTKSVALTTTGLQEAKRLHQALFASGPTAK